MRDTVIAVALLSFLAVGCGSTVTEQGGGEDGGQMEDRGRISGDAADSDRPAPDAAGLPDASDVSDTSFPPDTSYPSDASDADGGQTGDGGPVTGDGGTADDTGHDAGTPVDAGADSGQTGDGGPATGDGGTTDAGHDAGAPDGGATTLLGTLAADCDVPYVLDASKISNMTYMASHFSDLVQQYCITGTVGGIDIDSYAEKMYFGSHPPSDPTLSLTQMSMISVTSPQYSVKVDFNPDSSVTQGSVWQVGPEATAAVIKHITAQQICLFGWGDGGSLTFGAVQNVTQTEGGSFSVSGSMDIVDPNDVPDLCAAMPAELPCCQ